MWLISFENQSLGTHSGNKSVTCSITFAQILGHLIQKELSSVLFNVLRRNIKAEILAWTDFQRVLLNTLRTDICTISTILKTKIKNI